ncbi:ThiF family adenylyltransferase [Aetokthonos hydrillicola Thurmond2011]|jgi:molybdopterin/thiamine biosynthesis adenylyltransferase|uniref:ThiF family adenylyltransferase n=1 Tax=Aetokthonos hydrillicola Thurmond2011 TaxID=2712845 RepID=A0AAP5MC25_9CYAN|nr:ThiF family adenylyltransferase [Aetokthonos hydrillicola]MBO3460722.1 ThiF family adenylyltransferase [Aetokthonos hydrillicola CCALA 1050]MBW4586421.1 ThiF family adenylyltransferase [Aetokthonos hydrillicola CCALA 1050]MDR9899870.1 ThiF family adenylyltransferase [Aetokthonos hydrillicola Thurmond2011]
MSIFFHEQLHRTNPVMAKLKNYSVTICGAGALGANITENLARSGFDKLTVIDRDRIEERNLSTQPYYRSDVGAFKAKILANNLYRAIGTKVDAKTVELTSANTTRLLQNSQLIIDVFDNSVARQAVKDYAEQSSIPCLHAGLSADYAEVIWNDVYRVPSEVNDHVCNYPLARTLVMLTVAVACEAIISFISTAQQRNFSITHKDLSVQALFFSRTAKLARAPVKYK